MLHIASQWASLHVLPLERASSRAQGILIPRLVTSSLGISVLGSRGQHAPIRFYSIIKNQDRCLPEVISFTKGQVFTYIGGKEVSWDKAGADVNWCYLFKVTETIYIYTNWCSLWGMTEEFSQWGAQLEELTSGRQSMKLAFTKFSQQFSDSNEKHIMRWQCW